MLITYTLMCLAPGQNAFAKVISPIQAYLWIDYVDCYSSRWSSSGSDLRDLRMQVRYFDSNRKQLVNLPLFADTSKDPQNGSQMSASACSQLGKEILNLKGKLVPITITGSIDTITEPRGEYECGYNRKTGMPRMCPGKGESSRDVMRIEFLLGPYRFVGRLT